MLQWDTFKKDLLRNPETKKEYQRLTPRYGVISELIELRIKSGITQAQLAKKIGTKQSAIARLESGNTNPSLDFLQKIAHVLGRNLTIHFS